ncbi:protein IWS11 [Sesamum angolense]|uniref:Protein IWS11 n=1 Tax=Sesamum angolense TaxID=2727404 RepID=A0AAE2BKX8_9LAMI|nr:protein IWS11 [Sesamum angolense]
MGYENDPYRDEDGEPLMDFDEDIQSDGDEPQQHFLDNEDDAAYDRRDRSPTPVYNDSKAKPRKRLIKKSSSGKDMGPVDFGLDDNEGGARGDYGGDEGDMAGMVRENYSDGGKRKKEGGENRKILEKKRKGEKGVKKFKFRQGGGGRMRDHEADPEMKEMWDTVAGGDSEAEEGEEDEEIKELFKVGKKKKKNEKSAAEIALLVENVMAELEVVAEEDAELNRQGKPAISKLRKLSLLTDVLSKKQLQQEFLDHGVLTLLKNWLEPLPDGSLPNMNIRAAVLKILNDSRPIFNKSTRFEDMKNFEDERVFRRPPVKKVMNKTAGMSSRDDDLDLAEFRSKMGSKSGQSSSRQHASRPEAMSMDFVVRPQSKVDPDEVRARAKQMVQDQRRAKVAVVSSKDELMMNKKLQQLKAPKRKQLQATKLSVEGRGMVKYL